MVIFSAVSEPERSSRLSRSSLSETCSSPSEHNDRPGFKDDDEGTGRASFQTKDNMFYNKLDDQKDTETYSSGYSEISKRLMSSMGHKPGRGLGKFETGRVEPVQASTQKGRRGLGLKASVVGEVPKDFKWTPDEAVPEAKEEVVNILYTMCLYCACMVLATFSFFFLYGACNFFLLIKCRLC